MNRRAFDEKTSVWLWRGLAMLLLAVSAGTLHAQDPTQAKPRLQALEPVLEEAHAALASDFARTDVGTVQERLNTVTQQATEIRAESDKKLADANKQLDTLGEPPAKGEPPETPELARLRKQLEQRAATAKAGIARANLIITKANETLGAIAAWQQARMRAEILLRQPPPVSLSVWRQAASDAVAFGSGVMQSPIKWWMARRQAGTPSLRLLLLLLLPAVGLLIGWPIRRYIVRRFGRDPGDRDPTYARRIVAAFADGGANAVIPVAIILLVAGVLAWLGALSGLFAYLVYSSAVTMAAFLAVFGLTRAALAPHLVQWRIVPVEPAYTGNLLRATGTVAALLSVSLVLLTTAWGSRYLTSELESAFFLIQSVALALALAWLLTPKFWAPSIAASQELGTAAEHAETIDEEETGEEPETAEPPRWIRLISGLRWLVLLTPLLALAGYGRLVFYMQSRLVVTGALVGLTLLLRLALYEAIERVLAGRQRRRHRRGVRDRGTSEGAGVKTAVFWVGLCFDVLLFILLGYLLLLVYGVPPTTLLRWTEQLLAGITIGNITLSFADIFMALVVLALGIFATNLTRRWLTNKLLPNTRLDNSARDSIAIGTSYVGVGVAVLLAIIALGVDLSKLALIAGALSLGIGFGLQNVVQNFAAGILLLIERPIKVGDWIKIGTTEGTVVRISVRATEVQTFDRNSVFVPNADLISNHVVNWNHRNRMARLVLPVRAAFGSDPKQVEAVLLRCAREEPLVLRFPAPYVWFRGFGESALEFELRCYMGDTDNWVGADSGLYHAIDAAFREAGIAIPYPQRDLHIRSGPDRTDPEA